MLKRSGEISLWGCQWKSGGLDLYQKFADALASGTLSAKFPHRVSQLISPYLISHTPSTKDAPPITNVPDFDVVAVMKMEFHHAAERQGDKATAAALDEPLDTYLSNLLPPETQTILTAIDGLCATVAFIDRNREPNPTADRHTIP